MSYNIVERNLCKTVTLLMNGKEHLIEQIDEENVDLNFTTTNLIVTGNWLESLVRDVFPFKINDIIQHLNLDDYNFEGEVLELDNYPWKKRDKVSEMVLM